ncbi:hypothetical protein B0T22DRAFT_473582 [Podospora appendiculata]|uniref:Uncharacterized protein n=1 Tax=Podospora appendiculata TaxID=314037 RepID=A0AAE1C7H4_9PEZI|nr:hypothetical protein B0T22DRAFT_473582 [Podospora appendiculata]
MGMMNSFPFNPWSGPPGGVNQPPNPFSNTNNNQNQTHPHAPPGSWPTTNEPDRTTPPRASVTKRKAAEDVEAQVIRKEAELVQLRASIAREQEEEEEAGRNRGDSKTRASSTRELETLRMEEEVERLARDMVRLRTEADEEFARELAEEANGLGHGQGSNLRGGQMLGAWLRGWV